jgi:excisionase family DNA binding protein
MTNVFNEGRPSMSRASNANVEEKPRFLTVEELAEMLRVEVRTVYSWVSQEKVPFRKAGRRTIFLIDEILEWTAQQSFSNSK